MDKKLQAGEYFGFETKTHETPLFKFNITKYDNGAVIQNHHHENDYLSILLNGSYAEINSNETHLIDKGSIIFRPADYNHKNSFAPGGGVCFNIEFKQNWKQLLDINSSLPGKLSLYPAGSFPSLYNSLRYFINNEDDCLFAEMLNWIAEIGKPQNISHTLPWVSKLKTILENETDIPHSLQYLAEKVYVHPVHLAAGFKRKTGFTIGEYRLKIKLQRSLSQLFNTSLSINEIAIRSGFYDAAHFIRVFKMFYHTTPLKFRKTLNN